MGGIGRAIPPSSTRALRAKDGLARRKIGCGSGLHAVAAARLGVHRVMAVDLDPVAVDRGQCCASAPRDSRPMLRQVSVFELSPENIRNFEYGISWGVLHHTGAMREALGPRTPMVAPGGHFAFALITAPAVCGDLRRRENTLVRRGASPRRQRAARATLQRCCACGCPDQQQLPRRGRGVRPRCTHAYNSISAPEVETLMRRIGFAHVHRLTSPLTIGWFGSGCERLRIAGSLTDPSRVRTARRRRSGWLF